MHHYTPPQFKILKINKIFHIIITKIIFKIKKINIKDQHNNNNTHTLTVPLPKQQTNPSTPHLQNDHNLPPFRHRFLRRNLPEKAEDLNRRINPQIQRSSPESMGEMGVGNKRAKEEIKNMARNIPHGRDGSACTRRGCTRHQRPPRLPQFPSNQTPTPPPSLPFRQGHSGRRRTSRRPQTPAKPHRIKSLGNDVV